MADKFFPFFIRDVYAMRIANADSEFVAALQKNSGIIENIEVSGKLNADKTLKLSAWMRTDNGFCQTSGQFWEQTITLNDAQFELYVERRLVDLAAAEIEHEKQVELSRQIEDRVGKLRAKFF